jgi:hypothetical protein
MRVEHWLSERFRRHNRGSTEEEVVVQVDVVVEVEEVVGVGYWRRQRS